MNAVPANPVPCHSYLIGSYSYIYTSSIFNLIYFFFIQSKRFVYLKGYLVCINNYLCEISIYYLFKNLQFLPNYLNPDKMAVNRLCHIPIERFKRFGFECLPMVLASLSLLLHQSTTAYGHGGRQTVSI
jgi:hypothetical protein